MGSRPKLLTEMRKSRSSRCFIQDKKEVGWSGGLSLGCGVVQGSVLPSVQSYFEVWVRLFGAGRRGQTTKIEPVWVSKLVEDTLVRTPGNNAPWGGSMVRREGWGIDKVESQGWSVNRPSALVSVFFASESDHCHRFCGRRAQLSTILCGAAWSCSSVVNADEVHTKS